jgi:hypothetical protein
MFKGTNFEIINAQTLINLMFRNEYTDDFSQKIPQYLCSK